MSKEIISFRGVDFCAKELVKEAGSLYAEARQENTDSLRATGISPLLNHAIEIKDNHSENEKKIDFVHKIAGFCLLRDKVDGGGVAGKLASVEYNLERLSDEWLNPILKKGGIVSRVRQPFLEAEAEVN